MKPLLHTTCVRKLSRSWRPSLKLIDIVPENRPKPNRKGESIPVASIFRGYSSLLVSGSRVFVCVEYLQISKAHMSTVFTPSSWSVCFQKVLPFHVSTFTQFTLLKMGPFYTSNPKNIYPNNNHFASSSCFFRFWLETTSSVLQSVQPICHQTFTALAPSDLSMSFFDETTKDRWS